VFDQRGRSELRWGAHLAYGFAQAVQRLAAAAGDAQRVLPRCAAWRARQRASLGRSVTRLIARGQVIQLPARESNAT